MTRIQLVALVGLALGCGACAATPRQYGEGLEAPGPAGPAASPAPAPSPAPAAPPPETIPATPGLPTAPGGAQAPAPVTVHVAFLPMATPYLAHGSFTDNADNETSFQVERGSPATDPVCAANPTDPACVAAIAAACAALGGAGYTTLAPLPANPAPAPSPVTFTDPVAFGATYCYRVRAANAVGPSGYSNIAGLYVAVVPPQPVLPAPTLQSITP